VRSNPFKNLFF